MLHKNRCDRMNSVMAIEAFGLKTLEGRFNGRKMFGQLVFYCHMNGCMR